MSYSLDLFFEPAAPRRRVLEHFAARKYFKIDGDKVTYEHPDTEVYFFMRLRCARNVLLQRMVAAAEFEINYSRPSFFGLEAERELSALVAAFQPRIDDPQMHGMGEGPYSGRGFLDGWNFGNVFSTRTVVSRLADFGMASMSGEALRAAWAWNYQYPARCDEFERSAFVPAIFFHRIEGRPSRVVVWPRGMSIMLPRVDYVLLGRVIEGEKRYGMAPWPEVEHVVRRCGFDMTKDPLDLRYFRTPEPIVDWIVNKPLVDTKALERLPAYTILDDELLAAARESLDD
jgi:hypothetical protein